MECSNELTIPKYEIAFSGVYSRRSNYLITRVEVFQGYFDEVGTNQTSTGSYCDKTFKADDEESLTEIATTIAGYASKFGSMTADETVRIAADKYLLEGQGKYTKFIDIDVGIINERDNKILIEMIKILLTYSRMHSKLTLTKRSSDAISEVRPILAEPVRGGELPVSV